MAPITALAGIPAGHAAHSSAVAQAAGGAVLHNRAVKGLDNTMIAPIESPTGPGIAQTDIEYDPVPIIDIADIISERPAKRNEASWDYTPHIESEQAAERLEKRRSKDARHWCTNCTVM